MGTFFGYSTNLTWIIFTFWAFFICLGVYNTFVSWGIKFSAWYANMWAAAFLYLMVILDGLWLILGPQVTGTFSGQAEAIAYACTGTFMLFAVGILLAFTYITVEPLYHRAKKVAQGLKPPSAYHYGRHGHVYHPHAHHGGHMGRLY